MEILLNLGQFVLSLAVLLKAADYFIDSAEEIGLSLGISPFIIGVTIVAFGTSLPELATSLISVFEGESEIVIGNVVGSNITNIALVLGLVAVLVKTIEVPKNIWNVDMPYLLGSSFFMWFTLRDLHFSLAEAILFFLGILIFLFYSFNTPKEELDEDELTANPSWKTYLIMIGGGIGVWLGADYTINAIEKLSNGMGINSEVIALSMVALGTSLPEVIVSINAARKGKTSIAIGNVLGSNIFNTYVVMSIPAFFGNLVIPESIILFSLPLMIAMTILFAVMTLSKKISRWEGLVLLMFYAFFLIELFKSKV